MLGGNHHFRLRREFWDPYITLMPVVFIHQLPFFEFFLAAMADLRGIILQCSSSTQPADVLKDADPTLLVPGLHEGGAPQLKFGHVFLTGGFLQLGYLQLSSIFIGFSIINIINHPAIGVLPLMEPPILCYI